MKKFLLIILGIFFLTSCSQQDERKYVITKFDHPICDTLKPIKDRVYYGRYIKVKGFVDDTVFVSFGGNSNKHYLVKEIDTLFNPDYYGTGDAIFIFNPYKGKEGKLEVSFSILGSSK